MASFHDITSHTAGEEGTGNPGDVVINMGDVNATAEGGRDSNGREKKGNKDTLFGPSLGVVGNAPSWCSDFSSDYGRDGKGNDEKCDEKWEEDELTPEVVKEWVRRSKDVSSILAVLSPGAYNL